MNPSVTPDTGASPDENAATQDSTSARHRRPTLLRAAPHASSPWTTDILTTFAVLLSLLSVMGYVLTAPLASAEDDLDTLFAEVWDTADTTQVAASSDPGALLEMVRSAHEDYRDFIASRAAASAPRQSDAAPDLTSDEMPISTQPVAPHATPTVRPPGADASSNPAQSGAVASPPQAVPTLTGPSRPGSTDPVSSRGREAPTAEPTPAPRLAGAAGSSARGADPPTAPRAPDARDAEVRPSSVAATQPPEAAVVTTEVATPGPTVLPAATHPVILVPSAIPTEVLEETGPPESTPMPVSTATLASTPTVESTATAVASATPSSTSTPMSTATPTSTATPVSSATPTNTPAPTATPTPTTGYVVIQTDAPAQGLFEVANMRPGVWGTRNVQVFNAGRAPFMTYTLSTVAVGTPTPLWTDPVNGLRLRVRRGSTVLYEGPIAVTNLDLGQGLAPGGTDLLELAVSLPIEAGNVVQGKAQTLSIIWTATAE